MYGGKCPTFSCCRRPASLLRSSVHVGDLGGLRPINVGRRRRIRHCGSLDAGLISICWRAARRKNRRCRRRLSESWAVQRRRDKNFASDETVECKRCLFFGLRGCCNSSPLCSVVVTSSGASCGCRVPSSGAASCAPTSIAGLRSTQHC